MFRQVIDRVYGRRRQTCMNNDWLPELTKPVFLERFENSAADCHNLNFADSEEFGVPMACKFGRGKFSHVCGVADELGGVRLYDTMKNAKRPLLHYWTAHSNAVFDLAWVDGEDKILTASGDQSAALWDVNGFHPITTFQGHNCSVRSVAPCPGSPAVLATGSRDGHIMLWDSRVNQRGGQYHTPVKAIHNAHSLVRQADVKKHRRKMRRAGPVLDTQQSVTCVLYQSDNLLFSSGAVDGCVKVWDTRKTYVACTASLPAPVYCFEYPGIDRRRKGLISMTVDHSCSKLFASYTDNCIYCFDIVCYDKNPVSQYRGHRADTFFIRSSVSPDGKYLVSGSSNTKAYIWQIDKPEEWPVALIGHEEDVSAVDWCAAEITKLVTIADDATLRIWRPSDKEEGGCRDTGWGYAEDQSPETNSKGEESEMTVQILIPPSKKLSSAQGTRSKSHMVPHEEGTPGSAEPHSQWTWPVPDAAIPEDDKEMDAGKEDIENAENVLGTSAGRQCQTLSTPSGVPQKATMSPKKHRMSPRTSFQENGAAEADSKYLGCEESPAKRPCLKDIDANSPTKRSPKLSLSMSGIATNAQPGLPKPQFFSSPTMNLPNSVLDTPEDKLKPKLSSPAPEDSHKLDWLTDYRLSHAITPKGGKKMSREASPILATNKSVPASTKSLGAAESATPGKKRPVGSSDQHSTPKRARTDACITTTPESAGKKRSGRFAAASPCTPSRAASSGSSPSGSAMSIRRYFQ